jgi:hypothetical protein
MMPASAAEVCCDHVLEEREEKVARKMGQKGKYLVERRRRRNVICDVHVS